MLIPKLMPNATYYRQSLGIWTGYQLIMVISVYKPMPTISIDQELRMLSIQ